MDYVIYDDIMYRGASIKIHMYIYMYMCVYVYVCLWVNMDVWCMVCV